MPRSVLEWRIDGESGFANSIVSDGARELILVCDEGYSSSLAAASLRDLRRERVADLVGGFRAWREAGLATIPPPARADGLPGMGGPDR